MDTKTGGFKIKRTWEIITISVLVALIAFSTGAAWGINYTLDKALEIIPVFADIQIDKQAIGDALFRYNKNIKGGLCNYTLPSEALNTSLTSS